MPEPRQISPLLDNIILGDAISDHNGISCYPAMNTKTNDKFILKVISVPSSETKLEALLLTGALENEDAAKDYFRQRATELTDEVDVLQQLSRQEGFLPCVGYQVVEKEASIGYDVYILSEYRRTLERYMAKHPMTQLDALNLGLDICSALTACRRSGYLFANLKPSNIYLNKNGEFRLSDLGLISLSTLKYATLSEHYLSSFTAPEINDPFAPLNDTMDVYSVGMLLYSIYNGGILPEERTGELAAPQYADGEIAEIILKACDPNPQERWQTPAQMGQMLVDYMQKYGANDIPIIPVIPEPEIAPEPEVPEFTDNSNYENISIDEMIDIIDTIEVSEPASEAEAAAPLPDGEPQEQNEESAPEQEVSDNEDPVVAEEAVVTDPAEEVVLVIPSAEPTVSDADTAEQPAEDAVYTGISEEVSQILSQADELAELETPEPVAVPDIQDITLPEVPGSTLIEDSSSTDDTEDETPMRSDEYYNNAYFSEDAPKRNSHPIRNTLIIVLLLLLLGGGVLFYTLYVAKSVDQLQLAGTGDDLTVTVVSDADESLLSVSCLNTDTQVEITVPVSNGKAEFTGLCASSKYTITVNISGLHVLSGNTKTEYTTPAETTIVQYDVEIGETVGTVKIKFAVNGPDSENWTFTYNAEGEEPVTESVTGHSFTLKGLKENQKYTGILSPEKNLMIKEPLEISFTASELIRANDLKVVSCLNGSLSAQWEAPGSVAVESWYARCFNENYDQTINVKNTTATFNGLNSEEAFTIEVWAQGQTAKQTKKISANSITVHSFSAELATAGTINLNWQSNAQPQGGWIVTYWINDSQKTFEYTTTSNKAVIAPVAPGCKYTFSVSAADPAVTSFCQEQSCMIPAAEEEFSLTVNDSQIAKKDLQVDLCKRPSSGSWTQSDAQYTNNFQSGEKAGLVLFLSQRFEEADVELDITTVVTNEENDLIDISASTVSWNDVWDQNYFTMNIPGMPTEPGCYHLCLYMNNMVLFDTDFSVS